MVKAWSVTRMTVLPSQIASQRGEPDRHSRKEADQLARGIRPAAEVGENADKEAASSAPREEAADMRGDDKWSVHSFLPSIHARVRSSDASQRARASVMA